jgi:hypothetical protein
MDEFENFINSCTSCNGKILLHELGKIVGQVRTKFKVARVGKLLCAKNLHKLEKIVGRVRKKVARVGKI